VTPLVLIPGRLSARADNIRDEAFSSGQRYSRGVVRAGGVPVVLPPISGALERVSDVVTRVDAVILHGGGDLDPRRYGQEPSSDRLYGIIADHDEADLAVARAAIELDVPMLAICRGVQVLNVALGGTLVQDLGNKAHWRTYHPVELDLDSRVAAACGTTRPARCHSVHHQALAALAPGLRVTGRSDDGVVEAVELDGASWIVGVQWHPEDTAADDPEQQGLFDALVAAAAVQAILPSPPLAR
jgi:putative glutamine amidotransferase